MDKFSFLGNGDVNAVENMYKQYKKNPESVEDGWARFFEGACAGQEGGGFE